MQSQVVCSGCRSVLMYPRGASNVCCALCNAITAVTPQVPPPGRDMSQLICGGCRTLLMFRRGASSVRCSCCQTVNLAPGFAHVSCGNCRTMLMYRYGAPSVKCAVCHFVTNVNMMNIAMMPTPLDGTGGMPSSASLPSSSTGMMSPQSQNQTVVVENPMSLDKSGKLVSNVVVGVTTEKK